MENGGFNFVVGGENGDGLASGEEDFVDEVGDDGLTGSAGNADNAEVAGGMAVVGGEEFDLRALEVKTFTIP